MSSHNSNDPRQPYAAKPYVSGVVAPQDLPIDHAGFFAVMFGIAGVMFRYKFSSWLAIIFCVQSLANMRNFETDLKQTSMAMM
ncbi:PAT complex subunit Asterix [Dillenia turbinata]|uniref:PAT complex subunit Asterix n=1 Tax=Dillenia turbinata TaxID=194707 RepID=A0AAN8Z1E7_9MAGN